MSIGEKIRLLRMEKNLTQEQLAAAFDISVSAVSPMGIGQNYAGYFHGGAAGGFFRRFTG